MKVDLHSHTTASDGKLTPKDLIQRACDHLIEMFAITDHDTVGGIQEAIDSVQGRLKFIPGVELSVQWQGRTLHILGLNVDHRNEELLGCLDQQMQFRAKRAEAMATELSQLPNCETIWQDLSAKYKAENMTRSHLADYLLEKGVEQVKDNVFKHYMNPGLPAYIEEKWISLRAGMKALLAAKGLPVLAHPCSYGMSNIEMNNFLTDFKDCGGIGMEVVTGQFTKSDFNKAAYFCDKFKLYGSAGSDFHRPGFIELGRLRKLPRNLKPIWEIFEFD